MTEKKVMKFSEAQKQLLTAIRQSFSSGTFESFEETYEGLVTRDPENKKLILDQIFREFLTNVLLPTSTKEPDVPACRKFVTEFAIQAARKALCSSGTPITLLSDMFDLLTLESCEELFKTVEQEVSTWRETVFFTSFTKNNLLRICNDLLRRLSRTQNTVFCGRILLFLAKFFPFSERSGLNVISEFNLDNTTNFNKEEGDAEGDRGEEAKKVEDINVDYSLYSKFWQIQDFFRNPAQCYQKVPWKQFSMYAADVLSTFQSFKLDPTSGKSTVVGDQEAEHYFAKYLTNMNLLQLQLSDSNFRRYILLQFLILFQYLKSNVKFKTDTQTLDTSQTKCVEEMQSKVYRLLGETPPNGGEFAKSVKRILGREEAWNRWKNDGCPSLSKKMEESGGNSSAKIGEGGSSRRRKRKLGNVVLKELAEKRVNLGNAGLTALWNQNPDNLEACRARDRDFLPSLQNYFEEAIEQLDPANGIEDEYKKVNNGEWGWRALRLMSRRSSHFFISGNNPIAKLPEYLETMLGKMAKEMPGINSKQEVVGSQDEEMNMDEVGDAIPEAGGAEACDKADSAAGVLTDAQCAELASKLAGYWRKLAPKLGLAEEKVAAMEAEVDGEEDRCALVFAAWKDQEGEGATREEINYVLEGLKLSSKIEGVF